MRARHVQQELQHLDRDELPWHQCRNAGRVRHDLVGRHAPDQRSIRPVILIQQGQQFTLRVVRVAWQYGELGEPGQRGHAAAAFGRAVVHRGHALQGIQQANHLAARGADGDQKGDRVKRRLFHLNVVVLKELFLEILRAQAATGNIDGDFGGVQPHAVAPHGSRQQVFEFQHPKHACGIDAGAQRTAHFQAARQQLVALHAGLPPRHVQAGDHAVLGTGGRMHVEVFAEGMLVEVRVVHVNHGSL